MNKRNPISSPVFPFLDRKGLKTQFWVKQQAGNVLVETRYRYLGGLMFRERKGNHPFNEIPPYAATAGRRGHNDVSNGATTTNFPAVEVGKADNDTVKLHYG